MTGPLRITFARLCRETRLALDVTQLEVAVAAGVSRAHIAAIESGRCNPSIEVVERIGRTLGLELALVARPPVVIGGTRQRDLVHARCSAYVERRLRGAGWETRREVEIVHGRSHGWIDLLAWDPRTGRLLIIEVKTRLDDVGGIERQLAWYERSAGNAAERLGWRPRRLIAWLVALASDEVEATVLIQRDLFRNAFPCRAATMLETVRSSAVDPGRERGLALIDPASRRRGWLLATRADGRRSPVPYRDHADAAARLGIAPSLLR